MPRGRPRKNPIPTLDEVNTSVPTVDAQGNYKPIEETEYQHKLRQLKLAEQQKKNYAAVEEYYVVSGSKVLKKTKKANGNECSDFVCMVSDKTRTFIEELKAKHTFKTA